MGLSVLVGVMLVVTATPSAAAETDPRELALLQACATGDIAAFTNPFSDLDPEHWAYEAAVTLHYCGAYRGAITPEALLPSR